MSAALRILCCAAAADQLVEVLGNPVMLIMECVSRDSAIESSGI
jgi:hypothetical protein